MINFIQGDTNKKIKYLRSLKQKKVRLRDKTFILEGLKVNLEAIKEGAPIIESFISQSFYKNQYPSYKDLERLNINVVEDRIFNKLTDTVRSQGIISTVKKDLLDLEDLMPFGRYILVDGLGDPGNLGGIIRDIDAFNFDGIILGPNTVDILNEKVVRSTMASIFRVKAYVMKDSAQMADLKKARYRIYSTSLSPRSVEPSQLDLKDNIILIIGNEANGVSEAMAAQAQGDIHIPMEGRAESLNANVSASILMYESQRQRRQS
ncbi:MAG: RNA methyltransferase [Bacillota bacterium]|nr:RNA methyltransferase [Bacillota bacterium]